MVRGGLELAALPYGWGVRLRNRLYDRGWLTPWRAPVPVVSVGNLTLGGTGKTPCVEYVARFYRQRDLHVAILSRGYRQRSVGGSRLSQRHADAAGRRAACAGQPNDEALLLQVNLPDVPHLQGRDRVALARRAVGEHRAQVLVLDDAFQHRRLARDLDLVLIDATQPWGHGRLFPRGLLREPRRGLGRAGLVLLSRVDQVSEARRRRLRDQIARLAPEAPLVESVHRPLDLVDGQGRSESLAVLAGRPVAAFCGIGNPEAFRRSLLSLGCRLVAFRAFADHHAYDEEDLDALAAEARRLPGDGLVLTTQKDLVKLSRNELAGRELWALRIQLQVTAGRNLLERKLDEARTARARGPDERRT